MKVSLAATTMTLQAAEMTSFAGSGAPLTGGRDFAGPSPCRRLYRCRDGWIALNAEQNEFPRQALAEVIGSGREPSSTEETSGEFERLFAALSVEAALDRLATGGIPAVRVLRRTEIFRDSWLADNDVLLVIDDSDVGPVRAVGGFADWTSLHGEDRPEEHHFSRALGEDTVAVLRAARRPFGRPRGTVQIIAGASPGRPPPPGSRRVQSQTDDGYRFRTPPHRQGVT